MVLIMNALTQILILIYFCHYFIYNIFHLYLNQLNIELINYFLQPLLTELGKKLLEDIDLERMFTFAIPIFDSSFKKFQ